jgi:hypothetical protein
MDNYGYAFWIRWAQRSSVIMVQLGSLELNWTSLATPMEARSNSHLWWWMACPGAQSANMTWHNNSIFTLHGLMSRHSGPRPRCFRLALMPFSNKSSRCQCWYSWAACMPRYARICQSDHELNLCKGCFFRMPKPHLIGANLWRSFRPRSYKEPTSWLAFRHYICVKELFDLCEAKWCELI